ncbi:hypothetical protein CYLTODRAFT_421880 [Cylindrobasidium torrendii FP15055 ss-10]|uniref:F-box domain-containing protein n=1 Tax=Cylindrobasidium torrendii FP15055 ss-10 TaxID=1314674 RepID=A0A0D7BD75_9AGAR|nr:hypothetical protein CYLTODRAFT_421880 [Cylindrobasidium torrendii FP15055 ss-10]
MAIILHHAPPSSRKSSSARRRLVVAGGVNKDHVRYRASGRRRCDPDEETMGFRLGVFLSFSPTPMTTVLPTEILIDILAYAIPEHPHVTSILQVNSIFLELSRSILHHRLRFGSVSQVERFARAFSGPSACRLACSPRHVTVVVPGDRSDGIFPALDEAFARILDDPVAKRTEHGKLELDQFRLILHSHQDDPRPESVYNALQRVDPTHFLWTAPAAPHRYTTAIVAKCTPHLFAAISSWTRLRDLTLTNMAFFPPTAKSPQPLPITPHLESFYLGQVVFLAGTSIAAYLLSGSTKTLQTMTLVDVFGQSIWGPRVNKDHVLSAVPEDARDAVGEILTVATKTERIIGGDRYTEW